mmetsp:Transcript_25415/g.73436  ORF Transcript_25415/g.73436 Transcript_25415/m.73436 type:complete len:223 (+) Transcript_25415:383-1051(+)
MVPLAEHLAGFSLQLHHRLHRCNGAVALVPLREVRQHQTTRFDGAGEPGGHGGCGVPSVEGLSVQLLPQSRPVCGLPLIDGQGGVDVIRRQWWVVWVGSRRGCRVLGHERVGALVDEEVCVFGQLCNRRRVAAVLAYGDFPPLPRSGHDLLGRHHRAVREAVGLTGTQRLQPLYDFLGVLAGVHLPELLGVPLDDGEYHVGVDTAGARLLLDHVTDRRHRVS